MSAEEFDRHVLPKLRETQDAGRIIGTVRRGERFLVQLDFSEHEVDVVIDADGRALIDPPQRRVAVEAETSYEGEHGRQGNRGRGGGCEAESRRGLVGAVGAKHNLFTSGPSSPGRPARILRSRGATAPPAPRLARAG